MNVLGRWQEFVNDSLYCSLLNNQELIDYSEKIFGYIPGTESLPIGKHGSFKRELDALVADPSFFGYSKQSLLHQVP